MNDSPQPMSSATPTKSGHPTEPDDEADVLMRLQFIARNIWDDDDGEEATVRRADPHETLSDGSASSWLGFGFPGISDSSDAPPSSRPPASRLAEANPPPQHTAPAPLVRVALQQPPVLPSFSLLVQNLEPATTEESLLAIFFPLGAISAGFIRSASMGRKAGLVHFSVKELAEVAASKLNNFVPHGQFAPLTVTLIPPEVVTILKANGASPPPVTANLGTAAHRGTPPQQSLPSARREPPRNMLGPTPKIVVGNTVISEGSTLSGRTSAQADTVVPSARPGRTYSPPPPSAAHSRGPPGHHEDSTPAALKFPAGSGAAVLQRLLDQHEEGSGLDAPQVIRLYAEYLLDAEDMTAVLLRYTAQNQHRGIALMTELLELLAQPKFAALKSQVQQAVSRPLVRSLLSSRDKCERIGSAVITAALFECGFIAGTPYATARKLLETHPARSDPDLVDALVSMTSAWAARRVERSNPNFSIDDPDEIAFRSLVHQFYESGAGAMTVSAGDASSSPPRGVGSDETPPRSASSVHSTPSKNLHNYSTDSENGDLLGCTVYITRLPTGTSEAKLRSVFTEYGELNKVRLYEDTGSRGAFGFVEFSTPAAAKDMILHCDRRQIDGSVVRCNTARSAIHDLDARDAIYDGTTRLRDCLFGISPKPRNFPARRFA